MNRITRTAGRLARLLHEFKPTRAISALAAARSAAKVSAQRWRTLLKVNPSTRRKANPEQAPIYRGASKPGGRTLHDTRAMFGLVCFVMLAAVLAPGAHAATLTTTDGDVACSSTDLLQTQFAGFTGVLSGPYGQPTGGAEPLLHDGVAAVGDPCVWSGVGSVWIYTLDTTVNTLGYDLTQVNLFHGDGSGGRDGQAVKVEFSTVDAPTTFVLLYDMGTTWYDPPSFYGKISIQAGLGEATGVKIVKITFNSVQNGGGPVSELDVLGTATPRQIQGTMLIVR